MPQRALLAFGAFWTSKSRPQTDGIAILSKVIFMKFTFSEIPQKSSLFAKRFWEGIFPTKFHDRNDQNAKIAKSAHFLTFTLRSGQVLQALCFPMWNQWF